MNAPTSEYYRLWRATLDDVMAEGNPPDGESIAWWLLRIGLRSGWPMSQTELECLSRICRTVKGQRYGH